MHWYIKALIAFSMLTGAFGTVSAILISEGNESGAMILLLLAFGFGISGSCCAASLETHLEENTKRKKKTGPPEPKFENPSRE